MTEWHEQETQTASTEAAASLNRILTGLASALVAIVAAVTVWPIVIPSTSSGDYLWWARGVAACSVVFAIVMILFPVVRFTNVTRSGDKTSVETQKLTMGLWVFVFSFGTAVALFGSRIKEDDSSVDALTALTPRLFVSWFLSVLTAVATKVLGQLDKIQDNQKALGKSVEAAERVVAKLTTGAKRADETAGRTIQTAAETVRVQEEYSRLMNAEVGMQQRGFQLHARPTASFARAAKQRLELMADLTRGLDTAIGSSNDAEGTFLRTEVLLPAILPYIGKDPWRSMGGIGIVQEGSYLMYSRLIEAIFARITSVILDESPGAFWRVHQARVEVFTTLGVTPSHFYNVVGSDDAAAPGPLFWDRSDTLPRWECYRAVQAAAVKLGRQTKRFGLTRCLVTRGDSGERTLTADIRASSVPLSYLRSHAKLVDALVDSAQATAGSSSPFDDTEGSHAGAVAEHCARLRRTEWEIPPLPAGWTPTDRPPSRRPEVAYPVLREQFQESGTYRLESLNGSQWGRLASDFVDNHLTHPARGLRVHDTAATPFVPTDVFAVGWGRNDWERPQSGLDVAFIVTLDADERGTQTVTQVLTPAGPASDPATQAFTNMVGTIRALSEKRSIGDATVRDLVDAASTNQAKQTGAT